MGLASWLLAAALAGCAVTPGGERTLRVPDADIPLQLGRAQTLTQDGVTAQLAIPTEEEVVQRFGVGLAEHGVQPIWMRLENAGVTDYWVLPIAIDPNYYTADEIALIAAKGRGEEQARRFRDTFRRGALPFFLRAGGANEGFVYATHLRGGRFVDLQLTGQGRGLRLRFAVMLPTQGFDYESSGLRQRYAQLDELPDLDPDQTRVKLRELPCCTSREDGSGAGDPLNIALVGSGEDVVAALTAGGWNFTEAITVDSVRRMIGAAIADEPFASAPVSALYAFGRKQDIALQRARSRIAQRNHMRLWLAPFRCEGQPVWVGQVSRDIGVKLTTKSTTLTTHVIDPNVDESREYLLHSLLRQEAVQWFAFVRGVGGATPDQPRLNLTDDPYFTDGMRMAVRVSRTPVPPWMALNLKWNDSTDPVLEGLGVDARVLPGR